MVLNLLKESPRVYGSLTPRNNVFFLIFLLAPQICQPDRVLLSGKTIWITFEINQARLVIIRKLNKIRPFWNGINSFKIHSFAFFVTPRRDYYKRLWTKSKPEEKSLEIPDFSYISGRFCQLITTFIRFVIPYSVINFVLSRVTILLFGSNANSFYFFNPTKMDSYEINWTQFVVAFASKRHVN